MNSANGGEVLVLAAGRGVGLDGFSKLRLTSPHSKETVLDRYLRQFGNSVSVVIGYRGAEVAANYPALRYRYNASWFETGSAYSAHVGLADAPVTVLPSDLFVSDEAAGIVNAAVGNTIFAINTENRHANAVNIRSEGSVIAEVYMGPKRSGSDPEFAGVVKIADSETLALVSESCLQNPAISLIECVAMHKERFRLSLLEGGVTEVNTIEDYLSYLSGATA
jgi:hypothetical protein